MGGTADQTTPVGAESPCIGVCDIGDAGLCEGCLRSLDEIARWGSMSAERRREILDDLPRRRES